jgi:hypothetical protein
MILRDCAGRCGSRQDPNIERSENTDARSCPQHSDPTLMIFRVELGLLLSCRHMLELRLICALAKGLGTMALSQQLT